jgi:hypothetical protein
VALIHWREGLPFSIRFRVFNRPNQVEITACACIGQWGRGIGGRREVIGQAIGPAEAVDGRFSKVQVMMFSGSGYPFVSTAP